MEGCNICDGRAQGVPTRRLRRDSKEPATQLRPRRGSPGRGSRGGMALEWPLLQAGELVRNRGPHICSSMVPRREMVLKPNELHEGRGVIQIAFPAFQLGFIACVPLSPCPNPPAPSRGRRALLHATRESAPSNNKKSGGRATVTGHCAAIKHLSKDLARTGGEL